MARGRDSSPHQFQPTVGRVAVPRVTSVAMITFQPDMVEPDLRSNVETALFLGVRGNPPLESTQLRWQVKVGPDDIVQLESGGTSLEHLGGALFLTTKEPRPALAPGEPRQPMG